MTPRSFFRNRVLSSSHTSSVLRRFQSSSSSSSASSEAKTRTRAQNVIARLPRSLQPYASRLRNAPLSHLVSFLILHEVTAVVPLVGLAGVFHWWGGVGMVFSDTSYLKPGIERFERYFRRKGWFGLGEDAGEVKASDTSNSTEQTQTQNWNLDSPGMRIVVEVAAAYAITKALLPLRLIFSVWATPWFARAVVGRVWGGMAGLGNAGRGTTIKTATSKAGTDGAAAIGKAVKEVGKDIPKI